MDSNNIALDKEKRLQQENYVQKVKQAFGLTKHDYK